MAAISEDEDDELTRDLQSLNEILQGGKSAELPFAVETANQGDDQSTEKLKQCLQKNYEVQAGLQKQLDKLEVAIAANKLKLDTVTAPRRGKMLQRRMSMASFRRGKYFKDHLGFSPPICHEGAGESYAELNGIHRESPWVRGPAENRLVEGVRFQLIEGRTRPLLSQLKTDNLSEYNLSESEARLKEELVLAKVEAIKAQSDKELYNDLTVEEVNWSSLSYEMFGHKRSANNCRLHWTNHATPMLNKEAWSSQENKNLVKIASEYEERDWVQIARKLGTGRSAFACLRQFQTARNQGKSGGRWSEEEDRKLKSAMNLYGLHNWVKVAHCVGTGRSSMNCYHRWTMSLCPDLKRGKWSLEEDEQLVEGVRIHGKKAWSKVCQFVPGRSQSQCRERYLNVLNSDLKKGPFTMDEDRVLLEACKPYEERTTCIPWSKIAKSFLPQRTDAMCSIRWKQLKSDDEVFRQYTNQALKRYAHPITPAPSLVDNTDLPEVVKEKVKKFKYRYTTRDKRKSSAINPDSYPTPDTIISWDNSELNDHLTSRQNYALQFLPSYNFRRYSAALKNGSSMFSPLDDSRNKEGQSSTSRNHSDQDPSNDQTMDETVQNILSNLRGGTTSANFGTPLNGGQQLESQSTPEPIDLTQDDDEMSTSSNVTAGNHHVAVRTTGAIDTVDLMGPDHAPMTSDPTLKPLPRSFHMPPAEPATQTKTDSVESNMNTKQNSKNSDTTPLMINDTVSCDLNAYTPTLVTGGSNLGAPTNIGTLTYSRDGNRIVIVPGTGNVAGTKSNVINTMRGEGDFPVGPRFVLRPLISEQSLETTAASNIDDDGAEESDNQYNNVLDKDTPHQEELNAVTTVATTMSSSIFSVNEDISTNENGGQSIFLGDETTACVVLPSDYGMSQGYSVDLHMVDGFSLINSGGDNGESANPTSVTYSRPLCDTTILFSSGSQPVSTSSGPNTTTGSIVSNTPVISNSASSGNFTEIERSLAAELLRFTPRTDYRTKTDEKRLKLEEFVFEMAGFDLPIQIATEKDVLMEADAHMIVYEPNHMCYRRFPRAYRRKNVINEDLVLRHFAPSQLPVPSVKVHVFTDKIINAAIVGDYHFRLQVYASYDILVYDTYCPKPKNQQVAKPWKRPTTSGQKIFTTGGNRKRKKIEKPKVSPQPNKTKRMYLQKKGAASKTVEDDANQQVAKPRKRPTTTGQKKITTGDSRKRKNIETPNSPQPKKTKRTYVQKKDVASKIVEDISPGNGSLMAAAKKCTKRAPAKSLQRTPKQTTKTATECEPNTDPPTEQATKDPSNESIKGKRSYRKRKCPPEYSNTSEQSAATPSTSKAMDCTTTPSGGVSKILSNKNQTPRIEDGDETANIDDVIVVSPPPVEDGDETATPSETVKRRRKTVKYY